MATKQVRKARQPKVYPDEQKLEQQITPLVDKGDKRSEKESELLRDLKSQLGALKFTRLAKHRTAKAIGMIRNIGKLGTAAYTRTDDQVKKLNALLTTEVQNCNVALSAKVRGEKKQIEVDL